MRGMVFDKMHGIPTQKNFTQAACIEAVINHTPRHHVSEVQQQKQKVKA